MKIQARINKLVKYLAKRSFAAIIVPSNDPHFSEYVSSYHKCREYISGFNGSAGTVVVTVNGEALWTDSRYFLQAEEQLQGTSMQLMKMSLSGTPSIAEYLRSKLKKGDRVAVDAKLYSVADFNSLQAEFPELELVGIEDIFIELWRDREPLSQELCVKHSAIFSGENRISKLNKVREALNITPDKFYLVSALDEIAWLLNIRGNDIDYSPVVISYCIVEASKATLFIDNKKINEHIETDLNDKDVEVREYSDIYSYLAMQKGKTFICNKRNTNYDIYNTALQSGVMIEEEEGASMVSHLKSIKNSKEIEGFRKAMIEDGLALVRFNIWLEEALYNGGESSEIEVSNKLKEFRGESPLYKGASFAPIVGYKSNGAVVHYSVTPESSQVIEKAGLLLMDSGGQYECGTTDITRTIHLSTPTKQEQTDFTLVLQGNIDLANAVFFKGTRGSQLDILARRALMSHCINYLHGTGHGIGHYLNVHEGPQSIRMEENSVVLKEGMVMSNEPAMYRKGEYGIRTENVMVVQPHCINEFGEFLKFETLTLFPIDIRCVVVDMLTTEQRSWLNNYHKQVYDKLATHLTPKEKVWLSLKTKQI